MLTGRVDLARAPVEPGQTEVTARHERTETEGLGQRERVLVVGVSRPDVRALTPSGDLAEQAERMSLVPAFCVGAREGKGPLGDCLGLVEISRDEMRFT